MGVTQEQGAGGGEASAAHAADSGGHATARRACYIGGKAQRACSAVREGWPMDGAAQKYVGPTPTGLELRSPHTVAWQLWLL